ncbi:MAG: DPP IV N-terminal domain-containing protein [Bacteroidales bacterium]
MQELHPDIFKVSKTYLDDATKLMIFTNTQRVWRYNTKGDYWVMDLKTRKLKQLGNELKLIRHFLIFRMTLNGCRVVSFLPGAVSVMVGFICTWFQGMDCR